MANTPHTHHWFGSSWFARLMSSMGGRIGRAVAGLLLIGTGLLLVGNGLGVGLAVVGLVPLAAGVADVCIFSALFGGPLRGAAIRRCAR